MNRILVFDLDDTLYPECQFVLSGFREVGMWLAEKHSIAGFYDCAVDLFQQGVRGDIFDRSLRALGVSYTDEWIRSMVRIYRVHRPSIELHDDARWAVHTYKLGNGLGLITDGYAQTQRNKVHALNLESFFDAIVYSDDYGREYWKPNARPYEVIMEKFSCHEPEFVYIGDNPTKDFVTAKALGWTTVRICRGEYAGLQVDSEHDSHIVVHTLYELAGLFPPPDNSATT